MKKLTKRILTLGMALAIVLGLAACSGGINKFDASLYVKGLMDECYRGEYDPEFLELLDITENEADETYLSNLGVDAENFAYYYDITTLTDDLRDEIIDLFQEIYNKVEYEVKPAAETDGGFSVEIAVTPIDIYDLVDDSFDEMNEQFHDEYIATHTEVADFNNMTDEEYNEYDHAWGMAIIDLFQEKLAETQPKSEETLLVQVKQDADGIWEVPEKDWNNIDTYFNYAF